MSERIENTLTNATHGQKSLWLTQNLFPASYAYNVVRGFRFTGEACPEIIKRVLKKILVRHPSLCTVFELHQNQIVQIIKNDPSFLQELDISDWTEEKIGSYCSQAARQPFDLAVGPLFKGILLTKESETILILIIHHIVIDLWSEIIISKEFIELYKAEFLNSEPALPPLEFSYQDYSRDEEKFIFSTPLNVLREYWKKNLAGELPVLSLPFSKQRSEIQTFIGNKMNFTLETDLVQKIKKLASQAGTSVYVVLISIFHFLMNSYTSQREIIIGSSTAGRSHNKFKNIVGYFVNPIPIRLYLRKNGSFLEFIKSNADLIEETLKHRQMPLSMILEQLSIKRTPSHSPLFQVMFNYVGKLPFWQSRKEIELANGSRLVIEPINIETQSAQYDLVVNVSAVDKKLDFTFEYNTDLFEDKDIRRVTEHYQHILQQVLATPEISLADISLIDDHEKSVLIADSRGIQTQESPEHLFDLFQLQARKSPHAKAIIDQQDMTYEQLYNKVAEVSEQLRKQGITSQDIVAVHLPLSSDLIIAILAILKLGAAFLPIDHKHPPDRINVILEDSGAYLLTSQSEKAFARNAVVIYFEMLANDQVKVCSSSEKRDPNNLAYVIYTSGSTGKPKGVMIPHRAICNYIKWSIDTYLDDNIQAFPLFTSIAFDLTLTSIFVPLLSGRTIRIYGNPDFECNLNAILTEGNVQICKLTPSHLAIMHELLQESKRKIQIIKFVVGGEDFNSSLARLMDCALHNKTVLYNEYGPTEAAVGCMTYIFNSDTDTRASVPIGLPIANLEIYLLNENLMLTPDGIPGEIYIGGEGLAWGYLNRPDLTAEKFIPNPFAFGKRLYKSGDLGRRLPDGNIEYLGRLDHQVKIRGFRIELGEIEHSLRSYNGIKNAFVIEYKVPGKALQLCAYIIVESQISVSEVRNYLARKLPAYMIPAFIIQVNAFPLTQNGKIDRTLLPIPGHVDQELDLMQMASNEYEKRICEVWGTVLNIDLEKLRRESNFFDLGGDSIKAIQVCSSLRRNGMQCEVQDLFLHPTIRGLSEVIESKRANDYKSEVLTRTVEQDNEAIILEIRKKFGENISAIYRLTPIQEGILFHSLFDKSSLNYFEQLSCKLDLKIEESVFRRAIDKLIQRHELLRSSFYEASDGFVRSVVFKKRDLEVKFHNILKLSADAQEKYIASFKEEDRKRGFDLFQDPLLRLTVFRINQNSVHLVWSTHHILLDGWCLGLLLRDLSSIYLAEVKRRDCKLPQLGSYQEYIDWYHTQDHKSAVTYWDKYLNGFSDTVSVLGLSKHAKEYCHKKHHSEFSQERFERLKKLASSNGVTLNTVFQGVWSVLLSKWNGNKDVVFGTVVAIRPPELKDIENNIGLFLNTIPIRVQIDINTTWKELFAKIQTSWSASLPHAFLPLNEVQKDHKELINHLVVYSQFPHLDIADEFTVSALDVFEQTNYDFNLYITPSKDICAVDMVYNSKAFTAEEIDVLFNSLLTVIDQLIDNHQCLIQDVELVDANTRDALLQLSIGKTRPREYKDLLSFFQEHVVNDPSRIAIEYKDEYFDFHRIDKQSSQLASHLRKQGISKNSIVGIYLERSPKVIIALLGILKAGGAYLPLDIDASKERNQLIVQSSGCAAVIVDQLSSFQSHSLVLPYENAFLENDEEFVCGQYAASDLAYVIYTSGSTGMPKGVMIDRGSLSDRLITLQENYPLEIGEAYLWKTNFTFDVSCVELFSWIVAGTRLVVAERDMEKDPQEIAKIITKKSITHINFVPSMFKTFLDVLSSDHLLGVFNQLKYLFSAGEELTQDTVKQFVAFSRKTKLLNLYGPTEATIYATEKVVESCERQNVPIGLPLTNTQALVLDKQLHLVPMGVAGDLFLSGSGLALGYLNKPDLTAEKFIPSPFSYGERLYCTGDIAKWSFNGEIEYLGRSDFQVKVRGYRIEIGEIEHQIRESTLVNETVVKVIEQGNEKVLCAYYVSNGDPSAVELKLKEYLKKVLPGYMIPTFFILLERLPLNSSGKIDRSQLPHPLAKKLALSENLLDLDGKGRRLLDLWGTVLEIPKEKVDVGIDFFESGGHSLKAMRLLAHVRNEWGIEISIRDFFENPHFQFILSALNSEDESRNPFTLHKTNLTFYPLTPSQKRLFVLHQLYPEATNYNLPGAFLMKGSLDLPLLQEAFRKLIFLHESLRTQFSWQAQQPMQQVLEDCDEDLEILESTTEAISDLIKGFVKPFNLNKAPLIRARLVKLKTQEYLLLVDAHHIAVDGASLSLLVRDFMKIYSDESIEKSPFAFKDFALQYQKYAENLNYTKQKEFWLDYLSGDLPVLNMATDFPRTPDANFAGERLVFHWDQSILKSLQAFSIKENSTVNITLLSILNVLLHRYTGQEDVLLGLPIAGRQLHPALENIVGMFVNSLVLRTKPKGNSSFLQFLHHVRESCLQIYENQDYPFEKILEDLKISRNDNRNPLFDIFFAYQNMPRADFQLASLNVSEIMVAPSEIKFDLSFEVFENEDGLTFYVDYSSALFRKATMIRLMNHYQTLTKSVLNSPQSCLNELKMLSLEEEKDLHLLNDTAKDYPKHETIISLFEKQVKRTPKATALQQIGETLTYQEFAEEITQLAAVLQKQGIGVGSIVALMADRSIEMMIAIYAILKAGGAYFPLDPSFPMERKAMLLQASGAALIVTQNLDWLPPSLNQKHWLLCRKHAVPLQEFQEVAIKPHDLAYLLFTSGSTGMPKGVLIPHGAVINRLDWMQKVYPIKSDDMIMQKTPITFDVSVWELFWWAFEGASLFLLAPTEEKNPGRMLDLLEEFPITVMHFVPSMLSAFLEYNRTLRSKKNNTLRQVFTSGEALQVAQVHKFYEQFNKALLINLYGPTEATVDVSHFPCEKECKNTTIPIGKPIQNIELYVLDCSYNLQPIGVPGELYIGGIGLAWGYLGRADLTAERFVPNPHSANSRLYKTGDLARWLPDGNIEFLGRVDHQIKIRGIRIELGEIEAILNEAPYVKQGMVVVKTRTEGACQLIAYVLLSTCEKHGNSVSQIVDIKAFLQNKLPGYMLPAEIVVLPQFPLTSSGKVDTKKLPVPTYEPSHVEPSLLSDEESSIAKKLISIWEELLQKKGITEKDNFYDLGGDSILAIQAIARARTVGLEVNLQEFLQLQTVEQLSKAIVGHNQENMFKDQSLIVGTINLSPIQKWFLELKLHNPHHFNQAVLLRLENEIDRSTLKAALEALYMHHDMLRAIYTSENQLLIQEPAQCSILEFSDLSHLDPALWEKEISAQKEKAQKGFTLSQGNLIKVVYFYFGGKQKAQMLWIMHHLITDGVSWRILLEDFFSACLKIAMGEAPSFPQKTVSFNTWSNFLVNQGAHKHYNVDFWIQNCLGPDFHTPTDPQVQEKTTLATARVMGHLSEQTTKKLISAAHSLYQVDIQTMLLGALSEMLHDLFKTEKVLIAVEGHGRDYSWDESAIDLSRTIGWFTALYPIPLCFDPSASVKDRVKLIRNTLSKASQKGIDYGLCRYLGNDPELAAKLANIHPKICMNYLGQLDSFGEQSALFTPLSDDRGPLQDVHNDPIYLLELNAYIINQKLTCEWTYSTQHYSKDTVNKISESFLEKLNNYLPRDPTEFIAYNFPHAQIDSKNLKSLLSQIKGKR